MRVAGIMSGTSLDGIDVAVIDIEGTANSMSWRIARSPYPQGAGGRFSPYRTQTTHTAHDFTIELHCWRICMRKP